MKWWKKSIVIIVVFVCICVVLKLIDPYIETDWKIRRELQNSDHIALRLSSLYHNLGLANNESNRSINDSLMMEKCKEIVKKNDRRFFYYTDYSNIITDGQLIILAVSSNPQNKSFGNPFHSKEDRVFLTQEMIDKIDFSKYQEIMPGK